jgi:hypothetical protein
MIHGGRRHADGRGAAHEHARDAGAEQDPSGGDRAGAEDRELVSAMTLGDPRRLVAELLGELHALDDVGRGQASAECDAEARHPPHSP